MKWFKVGDRAAHRGAFSSVAGVIMEEVELDPARYVGDGSDTFLVLGETSGFVRLSIDEVVGDREDLGEATSMVVRRESLRSPEEIMGEVRFPAPVSLKKRRLTTAARARK